MNILLLFGLILTLGLVGPIAADEVENVLDCAPKVVLDARSLEKDFLALESNLESRLKASESSRSFEALMEASKDLVSQRDPTGSGDKSRNRRIKKAAKKFVSLEKALNKCDFHGYYILASNYKGALNCPMLQSAIREAIRRHSNNCRKTYLGEFNKKKAKRNLMDKIDKLIDQQVVERVFASKEEASKTNARSMESILRNNLWAPIRKVDDLLLANIVELVKRNKHGKYFKKPESAQSEDQAAAGAKFRTQVYQKQLIKPCKKLVKEYADIFYAAKLDLAAEGVDNKRKLAEINPRNDQSFTDTWIKFRICQSIKEDTEGVLKRISAEAEKSLGLSP